MAFKIKLKREAQLDIEKAVEWYEWKRTGLGNKFYFELNSTLNYISENPELFQMKSGDFREAVLKKFPYSVIYKPEANNIVVFAVFHTYKNPTKKP